MIPLIGFFIAFLIALNAPTTAFLTFVPTEDAVEAIFSSAPEIALVIPFQIDEAVEDMPLQMPERVFFIPSQIVEAKDLTVFHPLSQTFFTPSINADTFFFIVSQVRFRYDDMAPQICFAFAEIVSQFFHSRTPIAITAAIATVHGPPKTAIRLLTTVIIDPSDLMRFAIPVLILIAVRAAKNARMTVVASSMIFGLSLHH